MLPFARLVVPRPERAKNLVGPQNLPLPSTKFLPLPNTKFRVTRRELCRGPCPEHEMGGGKLLRPYKSKRFARKSYPRPTLTPAQQARWHTDGVEHRDKRAPRYERRAAKMPLAKNMENIWARRGPA